MKVLIDECAPRALKKHLINHGHECRTVQEAGWSGKQNGELLSFAEATFDVFITVDTSALAR
jgi:predicted nuclease of predicted toxin-antitoxin system